MPARGYKYYAIQAGGTPQPLIGTWLTAAISQATVSAASQQNGNIQNPVTLVVSDSSMFIGAQYANVIDPTTFLTERARVVSVPSATTVSVQGLQSGHPGGAYGTGSWVALGDAVETVTVQSTDGNTGALFIGSAAQMNTTTGLYVMKKLVKVAAATQPTEANFTPGSPTMSMALSQFWIDGTSADTYIPSVILV